MVHTQIIPLLTPVYLQARRGDCADYTMLSAVRHLGIDVDEAYLIRQEDLTIQEVSTRMVRDGYIK